MTAFSDNLVKRNDSVFTAGTPCQPLHQSHFSDWEPWTLSNSRANTKCLFQSRGFAYFWQVVCNGIVSAHQRAQTPSSCSQLCKHFCFGVDNSIPFHHFSGPSSGWWRKAFSVQLKITPRYLFQLSHMLRKQSQLLCRRCPSTLCLPTPSAPWRH